MTQTSVILVGTMLLVVLAIYRSKRTNQGDSGPQHPVQAATHPSVPTDLFSPQFLGDAPWWHKSNAGIPRLAAQQGHSISVRDQPTIDWLCRAGDQLGHCVGSTLAHLSDNGQLSPHATEEQKERLFALLLADLMVSMHDVLKKQERRRTEIDPLMSCLTTVLVDRPIEKTRYKELLERAKPDERLEFVATVGAADLESNDEQLFQALRQAIANLRLTATQLVRELPLEEPAVEPE